MTLRDCRSCGKSIGFVVMKSTGKKMPVDGEPVVLSDEQRRTDSFRYVTEDGQIRRGDESAPGEKLFRPHWTNCTEGDQWRRARPKGGR